MNYLQTFLLLVNYFLSSYFVGITKDYVATRGLRCHFIHILFGYEYKYTYVNSSLILQ